MDGTRLIPLSQGMHAIVDAADYEMVNQFHWHIRKDGRRFYATRTVRLRLEDGSVQRTSIDMHRFILGLPRGDRSVVDHRDGNGLNNTRSNLRQCTIRENSWRFFRKLPSSGFRGVYWCKRTQTWAAVIRVKAERIKLGHFKTAEEAAEAYDRAAVERRGEFAVTNAMLRAYAN